MTLSSIHTRFMAALLFLLAGIYPAPLTSGQEKPPAGKPINLDRELQAKEPTNVALSYYHFALAKWYESKGDYSRALTEMRAALKYNDSSASVRVELAGMLADSGNVREALEIAQEAARIDPKDPEPHMLLANIYLKPQARNRSANQEAMRKALAELETMRDIAPEDSRAYFPLGGLYFELGEPEKAINSLEKFQSLVPGVDDGYLAIAEYYQRAQKNDQAVEYLNKAIQSKPDSPRSLMTLANLYSRMRKFKEAIPVYRKVLELTGENQAVKKQFAATLVDAGEFSEAVPLLEGVVKIMPQDREARLLLGRALTGSRRFAQAVETFRAVLEEDPKNLEAEYYLAIAYEQSGEPAEALKIFSQLLDETKAGSEEQKSNRLVFQEHLAANYQDMGENDKAIAVYEEMVKSQKQPDARLVFLLINACRINRQLDKALALVKQYAGQFPGDANIGLVHARTLADAGKTREGVEILLKMLQADPSNVDIYVNLSQVYLQGKRYADAERVLRRAEDRKLDEERVKFQLATVYERQKDFDRAESLFKDMLKSNPKNAIVLNYIGYMLADRGVRLEEAVKYVEEALAIDPNNGAYLDSLGWAFYRLNDLEKAEKYLLKAVNIVKNDPTIHDHLGDLYFKVGDLGKARDYWSKSLANGTEPEEMQKVRDKLEKLEETLRKQKRRQ